MARVSYKKAIDTIEVLTVLERFSPAVAGTPPLGLDLPSSDIDILCEVQDEDAFVRTVWSQYAENSDFRMWQWIGDDRPVVACFLAEGWPFEIFGGKQPVDNQPGWRHFKVEQRLLRLGGDWLKSAIMECRHLGMKTEPAFANALGFEGDPYLTLLELDTMNDDQLESLVAKTLLARNHRPQT